MRSRQKILDATVAMVAEQGFGAVNVAAVATAAGVSRQTVYSIFGTREDLVSQAMAGLLTELRAQMDARLAGAETVQEYVVELIVLGRAQFREHPALTQMMIAGQGNPIFDADMMARAKLVGHELHRPLAERFPQVRDDLDGLMEAVIRMAMSIVLFDSDLVHSDDDLRRFLARWLAPALP